MSKETRHSEARQRVIQVAEALFHQYGYRAVTMRHIAEAAGIRQASLYYHAPKGKEQLYKEATEDSLVRLQNELEQVITQADDDLSTLLANIADWFVGQSPLKLACVFASDMPAISPQTAQHLTHLAHQALFIPILNVLKTAQARGEIRSVNAESATSLFLSMVFSIVDPAR